MIEINYMIKGFLSIVLITYGGKSCICGDLKHLKFCIDMNLPVFLIFSIKLYSLATSLTRFRK